MNTASVIEQTQAFVKEQLLGEGSGHDWWHIYRVWQMAVRLAEKEQADMFVVQLAALLHEVGDYKLFAETVDVPKVVTDLLSKQNVDPKVIARVIDIIQHMSYHKSIGAAPRKKSREEQVVQDADRLDAIGAIGIARTFTYGGSKKRILYEPKTPPQKYLSAEAYKKSAPPTINHFYEKLLLLKGLMNTQTAKTIATERHQFMEQFLERFYQEWEGKA